MEKHLAARWVVANTLGSCCALFVGSLLVSGSTWSALATPFAIGAVLAVAQWLVMRRHTSYWWVPVTAVAGSLGFWLAKWIIPQGDGFFGPALGWIGSAGAVAGGAAGLAQLWLLKQRAGHAWLWAPANAAGWALGWYAAISAAWPLCRFLGEDVLVLAMGVAAGLIAGALTAPVLVHMFRVTSTAQPVLAAQH